MDSSETNLGLMHVVESPQSRLSGRINLLREKYFKAFDSNLIFHLIISTLIICFGLALFHNTFPGNIDVTPQLWIFGPIVILAGFLVFVRGIALWVINLRRTRQNSHVNYVLPPLQNDQKLLPSYSGALLYPLPTAVVEDETTTKHSNNQAVIYSSNCDEQLPSYNDALKMKRQS